MYGQTSWKTVITLHYQIEALNKAGIHDIGVVCGYQQNKIDDVRITKKFLNSQWDTTNMVYSLMQAAEWLQNDSCVISYSDIFYHASAIKLLLASQNDITITYDKNFKALWSARFKNPLADLETFRIDQNNHLQEIGNRGKSIEEIQGQYMGLLKFTPAGWKQISMLLQTYIHSALNKLDMTSLLKQIIAINIPIKTVAYSGMWGEVDHISDLTLYESWEKISAVLE